MKQLLTALLVFFFVTSLQAQKVVIRDSVAGSENGTAFKPEAIDIYTYNNTCQLTSVGYASARVFYSYYSNGLLRQERNQFYIPSQGGWINNATFTYTYNKAGQRTGYVTAFWDGTSGTYINSTKDSTGYDGAGYKIKSLFQLWNADSMSWKTSSDTVFYNNGTGHPDSSFTTDYQQNDTIRTYYKYLDPSFVQYQRTFNYYHAGSLFAISRTTYLHDSADHVVTDSVLYESPDGNGTFSAYQTNIFTAYYSGDGTIAEQDYVWQPSYGYATIKKKYNTYGYCSSVLPVTFLNFSGRRRKNDALLQWQTANETNTSFFKVQRSTDGVHFTTIGKVAASGNSSLTGNYTYTDVDGFLLPASKLYYRLEETDRNGAVHYSNITALDIAAGKVFITALPNPAINVIRIFSSVALNDAVITISDMRGMQLYTAKQNIIAGSSVPVDVSVLTKGIYIVTVQSSSFKQQVKIVKE